MKNTQALILDFGSVISFSMFETHRQSEKALGLAPGSLTWMGPFDPGNDELWQAMQAGEISQRDYWLTRSREVGDMLGEEWTTMAQFVKRARGADPMAIIRPDILSLIDRARCGGRKTAILSNELDLFFGADLRAKLPFISNFDVIVDATYTEILKPDPRAYQMCLEQLAVAASDSVFIDDHLPNVKGAQTLGIRALYFDVCEPQRCIAAAIRELGLG